MSTSKDPRNAGSPPGGKVSGKDMADALADVLRDQNEKAKSRKRAPSKDEKRKTSPITWVLLFVFSGIAGYIWIGSPAWLQPEPLDPPPQLADAGLRMEVFQQALLVEEFLESRGRLPNDLSEAGDSFTEVEYAKINGGDYRLRFSGRGGSVEYLSTQSLDAFLGNSIQVIRTGG